jgi:hypothetical protein
MLRLHYMFRQTSLRSGSEISSISVKYFTIHVPHYASRNKLNINRLKPTGNYRPETRKIQQRLGVSGSVRGLLVTAIGRSDRQFCYNIQNKNIKKFVQRVVGKCTVRMISGWVVEKRHFHEILRKRIYRPTGRLRKRWKDQPQLEGYGTYYTPKPSRK